MRTCGIAVLILVVPIVVTVPALSQTTCQANRITGSEFNFTGSSTVTIPVNNRYWVFFGSLTNQSYAVRVTDTVTGIAKLYGSPGSFCGNADTSAF